MIGVLSIANFITPPFQKVCGNYHVADVIICLTSDVHYNVYCSKSKVHKSGFCHTSITTNVGQILLTTKGKWLEVVVHMIEFEILNLFCPKQVQLFVSICVCGKLQLLPTFALVGFQEYLQQFILEVDRNLSVEGLVVTLAISFNDNVQVM
jgi:hypothetical protein